VLRRANRRGVEEKAAHIQSVLRAPALRQPTQVQAAFAVIVTSQVRVITALNLEIGQLGEVVADHFGRHRDAEIYASQPGLGVILGARVLAEFGDDRTRFADAKARKNYAGTSPITRASGTRKVVLAGYARNERLGDAIQQWAFGALKGSPGACAYYDALRARKIRPPSSTTPTRQPVRRHPARLPEDRHPLRRKHRLGPPPHGCSLTN
jgi:transposase